MTNEEKKEYVRVLCELNRNDFNNGHLDNVVGRLASRTYQFYLKMALTLCYKPNNLHRFKTRGNW